MIGPSGPWKPRRSGSLTVSLSLWTVDRLRRWIELAGVDFRAFRLLLELRTRETLPAMLLFVVSALVVFHFALPA
ncbi:MAG: hypothetical protein HUU28_10945, partial [Planctomycetaceae bacterium]|nr:hypothetical protein [Planctomycetaceae bacterium]